MEAEELWLTDAAPRRVEEVRKSPRKKERQKERKIAMVAR